MNLAAIISELREEHRLISDAISKLETLAGARPGIPDIVTQPRRRGRPPGSRNRTSGDDIGEDASRQL